MGAGIDEMTNKEVRSSNLLSEQAALRRVLCPLFTRPTGDYFPNQF